jgi:hypothetical protein
MKMRLQSGLPYVSALLEYRGHNMRLENVLLDTGSARTIFAVDRVLAIGLGIEPSDEVRRVRGVGGSEFVFQKLIDLVQAGPLEARTFTIQVGAMDYGFAIDGILGMDFLQSTGAVIDAATLDVWRSESV